MPSPDKDRPSGRRLGRLLAALRPSRAGPLPVQTGFPTSLADLVVKNHGRLKKQPSPSSKRRKGGGVSPPPSASPSPPRSSPPPPPPPPPAAAVSARPDLSPAQPVRRENSSGFGLGLGFLAVGGVVSLALLVIWSKKVVAAVTVAAFSLFLLESLRCCSTLPRRRPRLAAAERQLYLDGRGRVSPIREVEAEPPSRRPSCSDSERGIEAASVLPAAEGKSSGVLDESGNAKGKTPRKRSWKKLIASAKKLHKGRKSSKDAEEWSGSFRSDVRATDSSSGSRRGTGSETDVVADAIAADEPDSLCSRRSRSSEILEVDPRADLTEEQGIRFPGLVLVAVVLAGLVAGKLPAVALTMLCAAFFSSVPGLPCRGDGLRRRRRFALPVS